MTTSSPSKFNPSLNLVASQPTSTSPTTRNTPTGRNPTPANTSQPQAELPPPSTFDFLPPLHTLLSRLVPSSTPDGASGQVNTATGELNGPSLEPQHLATEATTLRIRIQKARAAIEALPDVDRTIEEQEGEIKELEAKVSGLKDCLGEIKNL
ncbi:MAG: hypothetical protein M4579_003373 [Chaenotheca gracillima]|nr:MAG: hypothetical protein M4579_003373 [Chaenotheca gracillima]